MGGDWRLSLLLTFLLPLWISNFSASASPAPAFNGSFADKIHVDPSALKTNGSKGLNGSEIDCSQIVPPPIPGNWTPEYAQQWTKAHWDCSIPAFRDFRNESEELNNLSDQEVFHFTPENIARSNVRTWYMAWSRETLNDPTWNSTHWPEVALFARDFLHTRDYTCYISMKHCIHEPNFADIQMRFPGNENRALVQRIYLQMHMLTVLHNEKLQQLEAYDQAQGYLIGQAFMIITTFTKQVDQGAVTGCEVIKKVVDLAIQIGLSMANGAASAVSNALTAKGSLFEELASINVLDGKKFSNMGFGTTGMIDAKTGETMQKFGKMMRDDWSDAAKFDWFGTLQQQFWSGTDELIKKSYKQNVKSKVGGDGRKAPTCPRTDHLDPGMASDLMCAAFEGDGKDLNEANTHVLEKLMVKWFEGIRAETQKAHTKMYDGWIGTPGIGQPSMMAILFAMRDWPPLHGPGSSRHPLRNAAEYEEHIKFQALKHFLGVTMSDDGIYLYCMHLPDAEKQCAIDPDEKGKHHRGWWKDYRKAQICPRPKEDPTLICSAARWYHSSVMASHVTRMPGISLLESFDNEKWNLTVKGLLQEAYENYVLYRNNETGVNWVDPEEKAPVFSLPTCVNDNLLLHDYNPLHKTWHTPNASHLQFPSICGDWRGNETKGFMKKINLDPESKIYNTVDGSLPGFKHPNELFWDRIPRVLAEKYLTPVSHYLALCGAGVRLPEKKDRKPKDSYVINRFRPTNELDEECDLVQSMTQNMTEHQANEWFCDFDGRSHHTVFKRQLGTYLLPHTLWSKRASRKKCHDWIKQQGKWAEFTQINKLIDYYEKEERQQEKEEADYLERVYKEEERNQVAEEKTLRKIIENTEKEEKKRRDEEDQILKKAEQEIKKYMKEEDERVAKGLKQMKDNEERLRKEAKKESGH